MSTTFRIALRAVFCLSVVSLATGRHESRPKREGGCVDEENGPTDMYGDSCQDYIQFPADCGMYDDDDFQANVMCCACKVDPNAVAPCCTNWQYDCYDVSDANSNNHACNQCANDPCSIECSIDARTDECRDCCITATHATPWNCPAVCNDDNVENNGETGVDCGGGGCPDCESPEESSEESEEESGNNGARWNRKFCCKEGIGNWKFCKLQVFTNDNHGDVCRHNKWPKNRNWRCPKGCFKVMDGPTNGWADKPFCVGKDKKACRVSNGL